MVKMKGELKKQILIMVGLFAIMFGVVFYEGRNIAAAPEIEMVFVKGGCFQMGDTSQKENPQGPPAGEREIPRSEQVIDYQPPHFLRGAGRKVLRGGSWYYNGGFARSSYRIGIEPGLWDGKWGFRLAAPSR